LTQVEATQVAPEQTLVPTFAVGQAVQAPLQTL
jgi:hypothetical protein